MSKLLENCCRRVGLAVIHLHGTKMRKVPDGATLVTSVLSLPHGYGRLYTVIRRPLQPVGGIGLQKQPSLWTPGEAVLSRGSSVVAYIDGNGVIALRGTENGMCRLTGEGVL